MEGKGGIMSKERVGEEGGGRSEEGDGGWKEAEEE